MWEMWTQAGPVLVFHARQGLAPVVGDWTALRPTLDSVEEIVPRRTALRRRAAGSDSDEQVLAANADVAAIVMGLDGDYNPRRLERYLVMSAEAGTRAVVLLNKRDVCEETGPRLAETRDVAGAADVLAVSALEDDLAGLLGTVFNTGETVALLGSSGAGKSTITNRLLGFEAQATRTVREDDSRGRHTTTSRSLRLMPQGWLLMDLPGLREVGLLPGEAGALGSVFGEIEDLAGACRFRDCSHTVEPGCAVRDQASPERLETFHKLQRESLDPQEKKRRDRILHRAARNIDRIRGFQKP